MKKVINIDIAMASVIDMINIKAYYTGKSKTAEEDPTAVITEIVDSDNAYVVVGSLQRAVGNLKSVIGEYAPNNLEVGGTETEPKVIGNITMPDNYDDSATAAVTESIRQYCEGVALHDWFAVTTPADAEHYVQQMARALGDLRSSMRRRTRPTRRVQQQ